MDFLNYIVFHHHCLFYKYRDEETGLFSAPSESTVQQLWMDVQQFEEASDEPVLL